jgi:hypothetical protein
MKPVIILALALLAPVAWAQQGAMPLNLRDNAPAAKSAKPEAPPQPAARPAPKGEASAGASMPAAAAGIDQAALVRRYGNIVEQRPLGAGGLTAWTVEKNGRRVVLYTTNDGQAIMSGIVWDAFTGRNLSDAVLPAMPAVQPPLGAAPAAPGAAAPAAMATPPTGALNGKFSGTLPESIKAIETLAGVKEGKGGPADTLYVIFDPRCPYCRQAYNRTRDYVKRGHTIKWIPAVVLGNPEQGAPLAATVLQAGAAGQADALRRVLGNKEAVATPPSKATLEALARSENFFYAAFQNNQVDKVGVPVAFFLDKKTGQPRMMMGVSEMPVIEEIFGRLP